MYHHASVNLVYVSFYISPSASVRDFFGGFSRFWSKFLISWNCDVIAWSCFVSVCFNHSWREFERFWNCGFVSSRTDLNSSSALFCFSKLWTCFEMADICIQMVPPKTQPLSKFRVFTVCLCVWTFLTLKSRHFWDFFGNVLPSQSSHTKFESNLSGLTDIKFKAKKKLFESRGAGFTILDPFFKSKPVSALNIEFWRI